MPAQEMNWAQFIIQNVIIVVGGAAAYFGLPWLQQKLALRRELASTYLVPFQTWCNNLYKELSEYSSRYHDETNYDELSHSLVIIDHRELHEELRELGKYIVKIEKDNERNSRVPNFLKDLENEVDKFWHKFQDEKRVNFDRPVYGNWISAIYHHQNKQELVNEIKNKNDRIRSFFKSNRKEEFEMVKEYLRSQIPR